MHMRIDDSQYLLPTNTKNNQYSGLLDHPCRVSGNAESYKNKVSFPVRIRCLKAN